MTEVQIRAKIVKWFVSQDGIHEVGSTNDNIYGREFQYNFAAWCMMFYSIGLSKAGIKLNRKGYYNAHGFASVPAFYEAYKDHITTDPQPGDAIIYDWESDKKMDHIGAFLMWIDRASGEFMAVEGNTSRANQSNGGQVMIREDRTTKPVVAFISITPFIKLLPI